MTSTSRIVLATGNEGKARELRALLPTSFSIATAASLGLTLPAETGATFEQNARVKAIDVSLRVPNLVVADDSGLEVRALDGRPGVRSARYAGENADDAANIRRLLAELAGTPLSGRAARFVCVVCLARSGVVLATSRGEIDGRIATQARGRLGFGYDPVFVTGDGRTMAELDANEKNRISHRGSAIQRMIPILTEHTHFLLDDGGDR